MIRGAVSAKVTTIFKLIIQTEEKLPSRRLRKLIKSTLKQVRKRKKRWWKLLSYLRMWGTLLVL